MPHQPSETHLQQTNQTTIDSTNPIVHTTATLLILQPAMKMLLNGWLFKGIAQGIINTVVKADEWVRSFNPILGAEAAGTKKISNAVANEPEANPVDAGRPPKMMLDGKPYLLEQTTVAGIKNLKREEVDPAIKETGPFKNTALHVFLANGNYPMVPAAVEHFSPREDDSPKVKEKMQRTLNRMLAAQDSNGNTPLLLSLKVGVSSDVTSPLINEVTARMRNNKGESPLQLAVDGAPIAVTQKILDHIKPEHLEEELKKLTDYSQMTRKELYQRLNKRFSEVEIDGNRAANAEMNHLFPGEYIYGMYDKQTLQKVLPGFQTSVGYYTDKDDQAKGPQPFLSIAATWNNANRFYQAAKSQDPNAAKKAEKFLKLSKISLIDSYMNRREETDKLIAAAWERVPTTKHRDALRKQSGSQHNELRR